MFDIKELKIKIEEKPILRGVDLSIGEGEIHAIMGPNGSGKSTLANVIAGHPRYEVTDGEIKYEENGLLELAPEERTKLGVMLTFQYPMSIPGVTVSNFLRTAYNQMHDESISAIDFYKLLEREIEKVGLDKKFLERYLNEGFSGGEKKKMEMLQARILKPDLLILDEIDSGLDVDALRIVAKTLQEMREESPMFSALIVTHYRRILDHVKPDKVHIMIDGKIVRSGGAELIDMVEKDGYEQFK